MIKFAGRIDSKIKKKVLKQRDRSMTYLSLIVTIAIWGATICCLIIDKSIDRGLLVSSIMLTIVTIGLFVAPVTNKMLYNIDWFYTVCITDKVIQKTQYKQPMLTLEIDQVKKIRDDGKYYSIIYADISNAIICQKSLLVEGTLEEFEALFEGKIVRKKFQK